MLLYADDLEVVAPGREGRLGAVLAFAVMAAVGAPFKWSKQRGGWITEWVGITTDYRTFSMGLSVRRAEWLSKWIASLVERKEVSSPEFAAGLGCLSFASLALPWERPLLGPLFAWSSAIRTTKGGMRIPWVVLLILDWIRDRLRGGLHLEAVLPETSAICSRNVNIWTDAKATESGAWIGGWLQSSSDPRQCQWFSEVVTEKMAPWLRSRNQDPKRVIAALEMLASLVALKLWGTSEGSDMRIHAKAFTDNRGNQFILKKGMSTKYPITLLVIEVAETLRSTNSGADLIWVRREENQLADDLTNEEFSRFDLKNRIRGDRGELQLDCIGQAASEEQGAI